MFSLQSTPLFVAPMLKVDVIEKSFPLTVPDTSPLVCEASSGSENELKSRSFPLKVFPFCANWNEIVWGYAEFGTLKLPDQVPVRSESVAGGRPGGKGVEAGELQLVSKSPARHSTDKGTNLFLISSRIQEGAQA